MHRTLAIALGAIALFAFSLSGCGSDGDSTSGASAEATGASGATGAKTTTGSESPSSGSAEPAPPDKARFIEEADAICEEANKRQLAAIQRASKELKKEPSHAETTELVRTVGLPPIRQEIEELEALDPPSGEEEEAEAIIAEMSDALGQIEENPGLVADATSASPAAPVRKRATEYGFKGCANFL